MRKHLYALIAVLLVSLQALAANADPAQWRWVFNTWGNLQEVGGTEGTFGTNRAASDGYDAMDGMWQYGPAGNQLGVYHSNATDNWTGPSGFYCDDIAAPIPLIPGLSRTWKMYVWGSPSLPDDAAYIALRWMYINFNGPDWSTPPGEFQFTLTLRSKPNGVTGGPDAGTVWDLSVQPNGPELRLPVFRAANGVEGYVFELTATVIPEPSSLAFLSLALAGVGIGAMRRRL